MSDNFCGSWEIISNINFEGYMNALGKLSDLGLNIASVQDVRHMCFFNSAAKYDLSLCRAPEVVLFSFSVAVCVETENTGGKVCLLLI